MTDERSSPPRETDDSSPRKLVPDGTGAHPWMLRRFLDHGLSPEGRDARRHVATCAACRRRLDTAMSVLSDPADFLAVRRPTGQAASPTQVLHPLPTLLWSLTYLIRPGVAAWSAQVAGGSEPLQLDKLPDGLRAEIRWPHPGVRDLAELVLIVDDWAALGVSTDYDVELGAASAEPPPPGLPWAAWLSAEPNHLLPDGTPVRARVLQLHGGKRVAAIPLTRPRIRMSAAIAQSIRQLVDVHLIILPPRRV